MTVTDATHLICCDCHLLLDSVCVAKSNTENVTRIMAIAYDITMEQGMYNSEYSISLHLPSSFTSQLCQRPLSVVIPNHLIHTPHFSRHVQHDVINNGRNSINLGCKLFEVHFPKE